MNNFNLALYDESQRSAESLLIKKLDQEIGVITFIRLSLMPVF